MGRVVVHNGGAGDKPFVAGVYQGDGATRRTIELGFQPSAVLLWIFYGQQQSGSYTYGGMALPGYPCASVADQDWNYSAIQVTENGFEVYYHTTSGTHLDTNSPNLRFYYIAFR